MNQVATILLTSLVFGLGIVAIEMQKFREPGAIETEVDIVPTRLVGATIRAPGRISGLSEDIELHAQVSEPVAIVHVHHGQFVNQGDPLVTLQQDLLLHERELAAALVAESQAELDRLLRGARESELETSWAQYEAAQSRVAGAKSRLRRAEKLLDRDAISPQEFDDVKFDLSALQALAAAALKQHQTLSQPARAEDVAMATARLRGAEARLALVEAQLGQSVLRAPVDGVVLDVSKQVGELPGQAAGTPLVVMCKSRQQRAMLEIDEFDVFRVALGQRCEITADGHDGVIATGIVSEIEPRMQPKRVFGHWAGERNDSFSRRVWVDLDDGFSRLPIGLPIRASIEL